ncbi:hypothetical protein GCM10010177_51060 [Actinomadura citrea]|nr:hypothetical protein GCM10010177_51060 [Actinomadura citrea]
MVAMLLKEQDALPAGAGEPSGPRQGAQVVDAKDDRHPCPWALVHRAIIAILSPSRCGISADGRPLVRHGLVKPRWRCPRRQEFRHWAVWQTGLSGSGEFFA